MASFIVAVLLSQFWFFEFVYAQVSQEKSTIAFTIPERDLIPEGITYDPISKAFFVGSMYKRKIVRIDSAGNVSDFTGEGQDLLTSVIGMKVDAEHQVLWAVHTGPIYIPGKGLTDQAMWTTGLFKYDLESHRLLRKYFPAKGSDKNGFNDLVLGSKGDVYVTATSLGAVYHLNPRTDSLILFLKNPDFMGANGICLSPDERTLFVATDKGITTIDLKSSNYTFLATSDSMETGGIDGLYFYHNSLVAVQNGFKPTPIYQFFLDKNLKRITHRKLLVQNPPEYKSPTTGVIVGDWFYYIANSQMGKFTPEGIIFPLEKLQNVFIVKIKL